MVCKSRYSYVCGCHPTHNLRIYWRRTMTERWRGLIGRQTGQMDGRSGLDTQHGAGNSVFVSIPQNPMSEVSERTCMSRRGAYSLPSHWKLFKCFSAHCALSLTFLRKVSFSVAYGVILCSIVWRFLCEEAVNIETTSSKRLRVGFVI